MDPATTRASATYSSPASGQCQANVAWTRPPGSQGLHGELGWLGDASLLTRRPVSRRKTSSERGRPRSSAVCTTRRISARKLILVGGESIQRRELVRLVRLTAIGRGEQDQPVRALSQSRRERRRSDHHYQRFALLFRLRLVAGAVRVFRGRCRHDRLEHSGLRDAQPTAAACSASGAGHDRSGPGGTASVGRPPGWVGRAPNGPDS